MSFVSVSPRVQLKQTKTEEILTIGLRFRHTGVILLLAQGSSKKSVKNNFTGQQTPRMGDFAGLLHASGPIPKSHYAGFLTDDAGKTQRVDGSCRPGFSGP